MAWPRSANPEDLRSFSPANRGCVYELKQRTSRDRAARECLIGPPRAPSSLGRERFSRTTRSRVPVAINFLPEFNAIGEAGALGQRSAGYAPLSPVVHQLTSAFEHIAPTIGRLNGAADRMPKRHLG